MSSLFKSVCRDFTIRLLITCQMCKSLILSFFWKSSSLMYLGIMFQAKHKDVGFSKPDILSRCWIQTGVARWNWLLLRSSQSSPHLSSLLMSETKSELLTQSNNDVTIGRLLEKKRGGKEKRKIKNDFPSRHCRRFYKAPPHNSANCSKKENYLVLMPVGTYLSWPTFYKHKSGTTYFFPFLTPCLLWPLEWLLRSESHVHCCADSSFLSFFSFFSFFQLRVENQTPADELPHNQEAHMREVHLWKAGDPGVINSLSSRCQETVLAWNAAGRPCGRSKLTSKVSINHSATHPRTTSSLLVL